MFMRDDVLQLSATDLVGHLNCRHLTNLDRSAAIGSLEAPKKWDPLLKLLWERGAIHERQYVEHLRNTGLRIIQIEADDDIKAQAERTASAMQAGAELIIQGSFQRGRWNGRTDILKRVDSPSDFGKWSYEVLDTKLARETKAGSVLQLCLYSDFVSTTQGAHACAHARCHSLV